MCLIQAVASLVVDIETSVSLMSLTFLHFDHLYLAIHGQRFRSKYHSGMYFAAADSQDDLDWRLNQTVAGLLPVQRHYSSATNSVL